jgi:hypothetical protein
VRLVIEGIIVIIVPLIASFLLDAFSLLAVIFDSAACISAIINVTQVSVISISPSASFLRWSETAGRFSTLTLSEVKLLTPETVYRGWEPGP